MAMYKSSGKFALCNQEIGHTISMLSTYKIFELSSAQSPNSPSQVYKLAASIWFIQKYRDVATGGVCGGCNTPPIIQNSQSWSKWN